MFPWEQLTTSVRARVAASRDGNVVMMLATGVVVALVGALLMVYAALARNMANMHYNDFGKFYYSARFFLDGRNMYEPSPATSIPVGGGVTWTFLNMNPPHFHLAVLPLAMLTPAAAALVWSLANLAALLVSLRIIAKELGITTTSTRVLFTLFALLASSATGSVVLTGQLSWLLLLLITLGWQAARRGDWVRSGAWIGIATSIKPFLMLLQAYFVFRAQWKALAASALVIAAAFGVGVAVFGLDAHREWLATLSGVNWPWPIMNVSILGVWARTFGETPHRAVPLWSAETVRAAWLICASAVCVLTLWSVLRDRTRLALDRGFLLLLLAAILASPLGWMYYWWLVLGPAIALCLHRPAEAALIDSMTLQWRNALIWLSLPGLVWPLGLFMTGDLSTFAIFTFGSLYFWSTILIWAAAVLDWRVDHAVQAPAPMHPPNYTSTPSSHPEGSARFRAWKETRI